MSVRQILRPFHPPTHPDPSSFEGIGTGVSGWVVMCK